MLSNLHTHTSFCDGKNTAEEMVISAIDKGFSSLGFSGHGYTDFDLSYCVKDVPAYIAEINRLKEKYKDKIQIYLGIEEDSLQPSNRKDFDYIIGSSHYFTVEGTHYPVDLDKNSFMKCFELFDKNPAAMAESYYSNFTDYILTRKPDIVGHFDLITKYEEVENPIISDNSEYHKIAEKYLTKALESQCFFEVNTGAIARGYRKTPYPDEKLLHIIKKNGGKVIINSDCHRASCLDTHFTETRKMLKDIGFEYVYALYNNEFIKDFLE